MCRPMDDVGPSRTLARRSPSSPAGFPGSSYGFSQPFECNGVQTILADYSRNLPARAPQFRLVIRQHPHQALALGDDVSAQKIARLTPLDPPPICELVPESEFDARLLSAAELSVRASLVDADSPHNELVNSDRESGEILLGTRFESPFIAPCTQAQDECFYIFSDLGVRRAGHFRLRFDVIERTHLTFHQRAFAYTDPFTVVSDKSAYAGLSVSSYLLQAIARRGLRVRLTKQVATATPSAAASSSDSSQQQPKGRRRRRLSHEQHPVLDDRQTARINELRSPYVSATSVQQPQVQQYQHQQPHQHYQASHHQIQYAHQAYDSSSEQQRIQAPYVSRYLAESRRYEEARPHEHGHARYSLHDGYVDDRELIRYNDPRRQPAPSSSSSSSAYHMPRLSPQDRFAVLHAPHSSSARPSTRFTDPSQHRAEFHPAAERLDGVTSHGEPFVRASRADSLPARHQFDTSPSLPPLQRLGGGPPYNHGERDFDQGAAQEHWARKGHLEREHSRHAAAEVSFATGPLRETAGRGHDLPPVHLPPLRRATTSYAHDLPPLRAEWSEGKAVVRGNRSPTRDKHTLPTQSVDGYDRPAPPKWPSHQPIEGKPSLPPLRSPKAAFDQGYGHGASGSAFHGDRNPPTPRYLSQEQGWDGEPNVHRGQDTTEEDEEFSSYRRRAGLE